MALAIRGAGACQPAAPAEKRQNISIKACYRTDKGIQNRVQSQCRWGQSF